MNTAVAPKVMGFHGDSGSGKTTLIERLIAHFSRSGLRVAAIKHAHHGFDIDRPGKDSYRFRAAGAAQVLLASQERWALLSDVAEGDAEAGANPLQHLIARFDPCDLVLVEGYRGQPGLPFIQLRLGRAPPDPAAGAGADARSAIPARPIASPLASPIAIAADEVLPWPGQEGIPVFDRNEIEAIARFIAVQLRVEHLC